MNSTSSRFSINWVDVWKSVRTMLVVGVSSIVLYFIAQVEPGLLVKIPPAYSFVVLPLAALVTELARRWATDHSVAAPAA